MGPVSSNAKLCYKRNGNQVDGSQMVLIWVGIRGDNDMIITTYLSIVHLRYLVLFSLFHHLNNTVPQTDSVGVDFVDLQPCSLN